MKINIIPSAQIDKSKWDDCIAKSTNGLVYATTVYLDAMAKNWDGFVADDYRVVMPVPFKRKFGIKYCCHVPFVQQLGIFGNVTNDEVDTFISLLTKKFIYGDYNFNFKNQLKNFKAHNNYILPLRNNYEELKYKYHSHIRKNLSNAKRFSLQYFTSETDEVISMYQSLYSSRFNNITKDDFKRFSTLARIFQSAKNLIARKVCDNENTLSGGLLFKYKDRIYNIITSVSNEGRRNSAGAFLFDNLIKEFSETDLTLDFEGSDIKGVEFFYKGFGAENQPYGSMHINNLPFLLKLFKQ